MEKVYYTIYQITNLNSGKVYIGKHKTKNLNDGYMGAGTDIQYAIMSEGRQNFKKEILEIFETEKQMIEKEKQLVNQQFVDSDQSYNRVVAGGYTWPGISGIKQQCYSKSTKERPLCPKCNKQHLAVNYYRKGKVYYRKLCHCCSVDQQKKQKYKDNLPAELLKKSRYKKKTVCDRCGFNAKIAEQMSVHFRDGNSCNVSVNNLRTYCSNCTIEVKTNPLADKRDILPDF
jgi:hypothetical protein